MRLASLLLASLVLPFITSACTSPLDPVPEGPESVRERLEESETRLMVSRLNSAGTITAQRRHSTGWSAGFVDLQVDTGEVVATADRTGAITLERLGVSLQPIEIPSSVFGKPAQLTHVRLELLAPVELTTAWSDEDEATATAALDLQLAWSLTIDGSTLVLGHPELPPVSVEVEVTGDGEFVHAAVRATAPGELWSWANLIRLENLDLILDAATP